MTGNGIVTAPRIVFVYVASLVIHVVAVYTCAIHFSPWLVFRWFAWVLPISGRSTVALPTDWYLQHLEVMTVGPALAVGYFVGLVTHPTSVESARFAWLVPTLFLFYGLLRFVTHSSVLVPNSTAELSALRYYFEIQPVMPTRANFLAIDSKRVLAQMTITAPFYAGMAYSLGAWVSKRGLLTKLLSFERSAREDA
jgi:hypothetical protein